MSRSRGQWDQRALGDILTLRYGKGLPERSRRDGPYPVYGSSGIVGYHNESLVRGPGIIIGRKGSIGTVHFERRDFYPIDTVFFVELKDPGVDFRYLSYMLRESNLSNLNTDAAVPGLNRNVAHAQVFSIPPLNAQRKIATVLSAYDDLIENDARRVNVLEELAQLIYRQWFVKFRLPEYKNARMTDSALGKIPDGWRARSLDDVTTLIKRGISPRYDDTSPSLVVNQRCVRNYRLDLANSRHHSKQVPADRYLTHGDVLINSTGIGTLGRVAQVQQELQDTTVDSHVTIVRPSEDLDLDFFGLQLFQLQPHFERQGRGATGQTELSRGSIGSVNFLEPPASLQEEFGEIVRPIRQLAMALLEKNDALGATRNLLLRRLISGELDVSDLGIDMEV